MALSKPGVALSIEVVTLKVRALLGCLERPACSSGGSANQLIQCVVDAEGIAIDSQLATSRNLQCGRWQCAGRKLEVTKALKFVVYIVLEIQVTSRGVPTVPVLLMGVTRRSSFVCAPTDKDADVGQG